MKIKPPNTIKPFANYTNIFSTEGLNFNILFCRILRVAAEMIMKIEFKGAGARVGGSAAGLVGAGMVIAGKSLSFFYILHEIKNMYSLCRSKNYYKFIAKKTIIKRLITWSIN